MIFVHLRRLLDVGAAAALAILTLVAVAMGGPDGGGRDLTVLDALIAVVMFGLILLRRRRPLGVLAAATLLAVVATVWADRPEAFVVTTAVAAYTVATRTNRHTAWVAGIASALIVYAAVASQSDEGWLGPSIGVAAWIGMATAVGDATRSRRAYVAAVEERARRAERTRDEEARRRVAEERVRIARDLHDVVAHHIAVINVHAGLAEHTLHTQPAKAEESLEHVRQAARTVLEELATILAVLRQNGDPEAPTDPVRGLSRLGELLESVAAAGLRVEHRQLGEARALPAATDQAAYRIVQEALTNAAKHGAAGVARLRVEYGPDAVVIDVANPSTPHPKRPDTTGHGLTGMRERATAVGGKLTAGDEGPGRFHVHAVLPSPAPPSEGSP